MSDDDTRSEAWIRMLTDAEAAAAGGRIARLYKGALDPADPPGAGVDNVLRVHSLRPETLDGHLKVYRSVMKTEVDVSRRERETLAVAVSAANGCHY